MKSFVPYKIPALALAAYFILYVLFYDSLQYMLDSDAVAYLTIAHKGALGDWDRATNGLWSPLSSWLLIPFIKNGVDSWTAAKGLNAFFGGVLLMQFWSLLKQLQFSQLKIVFGTFIMVVPICFFVYFQMFGDVLQLIFALAYISLVVRKDFVLNTKWVLLASLVMGVGYYAKSYSLVFFGLHFSVLAFAAFLKLKKDRKKIVVNYVLGVAAIFIVCLPWAFQLQKKYGEFAITGMAGKLNMSWYINSGRTFNDSIDLLIPPPYDDSPSFWEDPNASAGDLSTPFSSGYHFKRWVLRVGHTCLVAMKCVSEMTFLFIPIFLFFFIRLLKRKKIPHASFVILWVCILLPIGYLAMHIETRYIWLMLFMIIILGFYLLQQLNLSSLKKRVLLILFGISIVAFPLFKLVDMEDKNKILFKLAKEFKTHNVKGKIVTDLDDEGAFWVISYLSGLNNYTIEQDAFDREKMIEEMRRYGIKYYYDVPKRDAKKAKFEKQFDSRFELVFKSVHSTASLYKLKD